MYSTVAVAAVAMCLLLPISVDATMNLGINHRNPGEENNVRLECENTGTATATFHRMDSEGSTEQELNAATITGYEVESGVAVTFVLNGTTEGLYFCKSDGNESPKKKLVAYPPHLDTSRPLTAPWKSPFTVDCPYKIGVLRDQYNMEWIVVGPTSAQLVPSNSSDYQLVGSSLIISNFTPFIKRLICTLTVRGTDDFPLLLGLERRNFNFQRITIEPGNNGQTTITQAPSDTRTTDSGTAEFKCVASVPQNREVEFEMFGGTITTKDSSCTTTMPSFTRRNCVTMITRNICGNINHHSMALSCDYSTGYQISCSLIVDNLTGKDSSNVICRILEGSTSEATRTAELLPDGDSLPDVTLDTNANELTVFDNASVNVTCCSSSSLSWLRVTGSNPMTVGDSSTNLIITNTTRQLMVTISIMDLGNSTNVEYYCTASNNLGVVRSKSLRVRRARFGGFSTPSGVVNVTVRTGHAVALHCGIEDSLPLPAIVWMMNGMLVDTSLARYRVLDNTQYLVIYNLMDSDVQVGGVPVRYQCQVINANVSSTVTSPTTYNLIKTDSFANGFMIYRLPNNIAIFSNTTSADMFTVYFIAAINGPASEINYGQFPSGCIRQADLSIIYTGSQLEEEATQRDGLIMITLQQLITPFAGSTTDVSITVLDPITILSTVPSGIIRGFTGDMFSFNCTASGSEVQLAWYKNANELTAQSTSPILSISNASLTDTGVYQCYWSSSTLNMFRIVTWALVISDPVRPMVTEFLSMPAGVEPRRTVTNGTGVTLHLTVRADTLPNITWRFSDVAISESNSDYSINSTVEVEQDDGDGHQYMSILTIHRVTNATSGDYDAVINDGRTDPVTTPTQLVLLSRPPSVVSFAPSKGCLLSMSVAFLTCKADGLPTPTITFLRDAADFQCDSIPTCNISNGVLTFTQPAPTDAGRYSCVASSTVDNIKLTDTNTIDIQYCTLPAIINISSPGTVMSGAQAILTCTVSGKPLDQVKVNWTFGKIPIPDSGSEEYTTSILSEGFRHQLVINNSNVRDTGMYYCNAFHQLLPNELPISRPVQLTVTLRPMVTQFLSMPAEVEPHRTVTNGTGVTLHLIVRADTLPTITWRYRCVAISESNNDYNISSTVEVEQGDGYQYMSNLTIHQVTNATSGDYDAVINDGRTDPVTTPTQLVSLPRPPSVVSFVPSMGCLLSMSMVSLTRMADGLPTPTITFLRDAANFRCDSIPTCNISNGVLTFTQPAPTDADRYGCRAASTFDGKELTDTQTINIDYCTLPGISNVSSPGTVMSGGQAILNCTVIGTPLDQVKVNWTFETTPIPETESSKYVPSILPGDSMHQLVINNLNASDTGTYYCNAFHQLLPNEPPIRRSVQLNVTSTDVLALPVWSYPLMALGGVMVLLLIVAICFLAVRWYYSNKRDAYTPSGKSLREDTYVCGNVDRDSDNEGEKEEMEEFRLQYSYPCNKLANIKLPNVKTEFLPLLSNLVILNWQLRLLDVIGEGEFGIVYKSHLFQTKDGDEITYVAVKTLKGSYDTDAVNDLVQEGIKMKNFQHRNVLGLLGVCLDAGPTPYLVLPYMANGNLLSYLKKNRGTLALPTGTEDNEVTNVQTKLLSMCLQIASGMQYLAEMKVVHRDLAARNCMIDDAWVIKVADFGLTKSVYEKRYFRQDKDAPVKLPIKWMAIESIDDAIFTEKTDVWSFGVTCWEVFNGGREPYGGLHPLSIAKMLRDGERLDAPDNSACSLQVFDTFMMQCWDRDPNKRPTFSQLHTNISATLTITAGYLDLSACILESFC